MHKDAIAQFDRALDLYMSARFGGSNAWRIACHRAAKIAAEGLTGLFPDTPARPVLVELGAYMDGGKSFAHIGWRDDPQIVPGSFPMHWVVRVGDDLYDPTFVQLRGFKTPLRLPAEPYFFVEDFFSQAQGGRAIDAEGFTWCRDSDIPGLNVGYLVRDERLPAPVRATLMDRDTARAHARQVRAAYHPAVAA